MSKKKELKWHEEIFTGVVSAVIGITLLFNGFSYLTSLILTEEGIKSGPTKEKALVAFFSTLEGGWWKYLIVFVFLLVAFLQVRNGTRKHQKNK